MHATDASTGPNQNSSIPGSLADGAGKPIDWLVVLPIFLMLPLLGLLTLEVVGTPKIIRSLSVPVLVLEIVIIFAALARKPDNTSFLSRISRSSKVLAGVWLAAIIISQLLAEVDPARARLHLLLTMLHLFFGVALWNLFNDWPQLRRQCMMAMAAGLAVFAAIAYGYALSLAGAVDHPWTLFGMGVTNIRHLGYFALCLTGLAAGLHLTAQSSREGNLTLLLLFTGFFLLMWSGGRGAFVALIIQLGALTVMASKPQRLPFLGKVMGLLVIATLLAALYVPNKHLGPLNIFLRLDAADDTGATFLAGRGVLWEQTIAAIPDRLWFGHGEAQLRLALPAARELYNHPHNLFLQLLFQWGVVGSLACVAFFGRLIWVSLPRILARQPVTLPAVAVGTGLVAVAMVDGPFFYAVPSAVAALALAAMASQAPVSQREGQRNA